MIDLVRLVLALAAATAAGLLALRALRALPAAPSERLLAGLAVGLGLGSMTALGLAAAGHLRATPLAVVGAAVLVAGGRELARAGRALEARALRRVWPLVLVCALVLIAEVPAMLAPPVGGDQTKYQLVYPRLYALAGGRGLPSRGGRGAGGGPPPRSAHGGVRGREQADGAPGADPARRSTARRACLARRAAAPAGGGGARLRPGRARRRGPVVRAQRGRDVEPDLSLRLLRVRRAVLVERGERVPRRLLPAVP